MYGNVNSDTFLQIIHYCRIAYLHLPLSSSAAKKAARQSSSVTMGPQNQVGIHETTNLFKYKHMERI